MSEIIKLYENAGIEKCSNNLKKYKSDVCLLNDNIYGRTCNDCMWYQYPPFTAEKQLSLLKFCLKWGQLHILQGIDDEFRIENSCYRQGYQSTLEAAIANYINEKWEKLSEEEKQQVRGILE